jgi:hypothetical protein
MSWYCSISPVGGGAQTPRCLHYNVRFLKISEAPPPDARPIPGALCRGCQTTWGSIGVLFPLEHPNLPFHIRHDHLGRVNPDFQADF